MSGLAAILERFTEINQGTLAKPLNPENVSLENVGVLGSIANSINSKAELTPVVGSGFTDKVTIGWRRLRLDKLFMGLPVSIKDPNATTTRQLIPIINQMYGTTIATDDIVNVTLPAQANNASVTINASSTSLYVVGSFTLRFTKA